jgi:hypothetical protein
MNKGIVGIQKDGMCLTREQMPGGMTMECRFDESYRKQVADYIRRLQAAKRSSTEARVEGDSAEVTSRIDGKVVHNPLQAAMEQGLCQIQMPGGGEKSRSPTPAQPEPVKPLKQPPARTIAPAQKAPKVSKVPGQPSPRAMKLEPDLSVTAVELDARCRPIVTLENLGGAGLPASAYERGNSPAIQLFKDGKGWQGVSLAAMDRQKALMQPGGRLRFTLFQPVPTDHAVRVKVVADSRNQIAESHKENNTLERTMRCHASGN